MKKIVISLSLFIATVYGNAYAETKTLAFEAFLKEALVASPEAAKIDATLAERAAEAFSARVKENPVFNAGADLPINRPENEDTELSFTVSQAIRASDFGDRAALAAVIEQTGDIEKILALNEFVQNLCLLYARAWQFQETEALLSEARTRAGNILKKVTDGSSRGLFPEGDVELFRAEQKSFEADVVAARSELSRTKAELLRLSGVMMRGVVLQKPSGDFPFTKEALTRLANESKLPLQQRYGLLRKLAQQQLEIARLDAFPAVSPALGYGRHDDGTSQVMFGLSIPLPVFNRNQAEKIRAQGALSAAQRAERYASSEAMIEEIHLLFDAAESLKKQVDLYESGVVPAKKKAVDAYFRQFEAGVGNAFQLWQAQRELNSARLRGLELRSAFNSAKAQMNALLGQQEY